MNDCLILHIYHTNEFYFAFNSYEKSGFDVTMLRAGNPFKINSINNTVGYVTRESGRKDVCGLPAPATPRAAR